MAGPVAKWKGDSVPEWTSDSPCGSVKLIDGSSLRTACSLIGRPLAFGALSRYVSVKELDDDVRALAEKALGVCEGDAAARADMATYASAGQ
jgi:hypothetical protein